MAINGYPIIDAHAHIMPVRMIKPEPLAVWRATYKDKADEIIETLESPAKLLAHMDREGIDKVVCINYIARDIFGFTDEVHDYVTEICRHAPDRLLPCGGVDPVHSKDLAADARRIIEHYKVKLIKVHGVHTLYSPDDYLRDKPALADVYRQAEAAGVPVMIHTGTSIFPGARVKFGHPLSIDDIAVDFPQLKIIMAHGGRPLWMSEAFFLLRRHRNVYMDISGIPPKSLLKYFPRIEEIADKTLYGSDWPSPGIPGMRVNAEAVMNLPLTEATRRKILYENANRLLFGGK
jgi:predicted TIM-barrel fold metal-dependent hydrolase